MTTTPATSAASINPAPSTEPSTEPSTAPETSPSAAATGHSVRVRGAVKHYGATRALAGIDLDVPAGQFLVLLGPSGSGKSTLARALAGIERLDDGEIKLGEYIVSTRRQHLPPERRDLAMVFQDYALWPHLTARGNVAYALRRRKLPAPDAARRTGEALERVGLAGLGERYPHELSGGQQQRVALARALVASPGLLLFDEPLSNLDTDLRERLRVAISTLTRQAGTTAVYITHDQSEAFALADRIGVLDSGRLVQLAEPETIYHRPATPFVARFTGLAGELTGVAAVADPEHAVVLVAGHRLRARTPLRLTEGQRARLMVRPAATRILDAVDAPPDGMLAGTVIDIAYRGRGYEHVVACAESTLTAVFDTRARRRGEQVCVTLDPDGCFAYPLEDEPDGKSPLGELYMDANDC
ncbi:ABC transporter ATP-binding protein [Actinocrinis puniceicyclus]|uniref:ABC-type quaternary amine transporter n=1 Tax=Actinocrinis puniceicyclus TaxID=977794 RepID=A0A8J7WLS5_9ACTN|nr:ABC transporter ATP-binding protein [Actinocrinis puniceicyclus]MBS2964723.1 ABC transporter ATP-binding protein [Actinocrinis puniceicyclus]